MLTTERVVLQPGWTVLVPATANDTTGPAVAAAADDNRGVDVTVQAGDTLSEIAADHGINDWTRVWPANAGRAEPDGARFTDPDYIEPGWTITIPTPTDMGDNTGHAPGVGDNVGDNVTVVAVRGHVVADRSRSRHPARCRGGREHRTDPAGWLTTDRPG